MPESRKVSDFHARTRAVEATLIARLKRVRKAAGLTQGALAQKMGLYGATSISDIEHQKRGISLGEFVLWCQECGVPPSAVLNGEPMTFTVAMDETEAV